MGIFGAMTTAVGGLRAQSYALENISGNIANSQTTAFKRVDTSFSDLVSDDRRPAKGRRRARHVALHLLRRFPARQEWIPRQRRRGYYLEGLPIDPEARAQSGISL